MRVLLLCSVIICFGIAMTSAQDNKPDNKGFSFRYPFQDPDLSIDDRVDDLVSRLTLEEKSSQMLDIAPAVERLGIPAYNWWNEALHGVARSGLATSFPQAIGLAATWNESLIHEIATVISDEGRAKHHEYVRQGQRERYQGLTFWSPNINIFRDPRWGRGQETYGEDPYLTGALAVQFIRGLQGDDPNYLKTVATSKHYAVHSGPEPDRHTFDAVVSARDLRETYLPHFERTVREADVRSLMCAYNRVNGDAACGSSFLLDDLLRGEWGFDGYIVSDCGALDDIYRNHKLVETPAEAAALALRSGTDLDCGTRVFPHLVEAVELGLLDEADIDRSVKRLFRARFKLGMFDPEERVAYAQIPYSVVDSDRHKNLALDAARQSIVLLKNDGLLPLGKDLGTIAVIGPNADEPDVLLGNYKGVPSDIVTPLRGIVEAVGAETEVLYAKGSESVEGLVRENAVPPPGVATPETDEGLEDEAADVASQADAVILVLGLTPRLEGEEMDVQIEGFSGGDRTRIDLPDVQQRLMGRIVALGKPTVLVLLSGSAVAVNWAEENVPGIVEAWYPGQAGGTAIADVLFGDYNPGGRLPVTFYKSVDDLPPFEDYTMNGHTYRFFDGNPLYPFGFGLSYTTFDYANLTTSSDTLSSDGEITIAVDVTNTGSRAGDEVVQLYVRHLDSAVFWPHKELKGFRRIMLNPGETESVEFRLPASELAYWNVDEDRWEVEKRPVEIQIGASSADIRLTGAITLE